MTLTLRSLALFGMLAAMPALAHGPRGGAMMMDRGLDQIELSADQRTQIESIKAAHREAMQSLRGEMRETRVELAKAIDSGADDATVAQLARAQHGLDGELRTLRKSAMMEVRGVLTDEQRAELKASRADRRGQRGGGGSDIGGVRGGGDTGGFDAGNKRRGGPRGR